MKFQSHSQVKIKPTIVVAALTLHCKFWALAKHHFFVALLASSDGLLCLCFPEPAKAVLERCQKSLTGT